jgi:hypothetical protein
MRFTLLFDSTCPKCSRVADLVRRSGADLDVRGLHDREMQKLLSELRPGLAWRSVLLESSAGAVRLRTGLSMRLRLVRLVGVRSALAMARAASGGVAAEPTQEGIDRRNLLARAAVAVGAMTLGWAANVSAAGARPASQRSVSINAQTIGKLEEATLGSDGGAHIRPGGLVRRPKEYDSRRWGAPLRSSAAIAGAIPRRCSFSPTQIQPRATALAIR